MNIQKPKGLEFSLDISLAAQIDAPMRQPLPAHEGIFYKLRLSPSTKLSKIIIIVPKSPNKKGLYVKDLFSLNRDHNEYPNKQQHNGTR